MTLRKSISNNKQIILFRLCSILLEQGVSFTSDILGVLKTGKCFILILPVLLRQRIKWFWVDTDQSIILADSNFLPAANLLE